MQSIITSNPTYAVMAVARQSLAEALPPGSEVPSVAFIRRAAKRGDIRVCVIGRTRHLYNLDDVRALVTGGDQ